MLRCRSYVFWLDKKYCRSNRYNIWTNTLTFTQIMCRKTSFICCFVVTTETLIWPMFFFCFGDRQRNNLYLQRCFSNFDMSKLKDIFHCYALFQITHSCEMLVNPSFLWRSSLYCLPGPNLDKTCIRLSNAASFNEKSRKIYFVIKLLKKVWDGAGNGRWKSQIRIPCHTHTHTHTYTHTHTRTHQ